MFHGRRPPEQRAQLSTTPYQRGRLPGPLPSQQRRVQLQNTVVRAPAAWAFAVPEAAVTKVFASAALALSDFDETGLDVLVLGLITSGTPEGNGTIYRSSDNGGPLGSLGAGSDMVAATGQSITRIALDIEGAGSVRVWDNPSGLYWSSFYQANPTVSLRVQFASGGPAFELVRGRQGGNFSSFSTANAAARTAITAARAAGQKFLIALARSPVFQYAIDSAPAAWTFAVPQASVTTRAAAPTTSYTVAARPVAWAFAVPQAAAVAVTSYTVSARPAAWAFNVPRASIESVTFHRVPASNVAWEFAVPRAAAVVARRVNVSPASWSFNVPRASAGSVTSYTVAAGAAAWAFAVPRASSMVARRVNVSPASWSFNVPRASAGSVTSYTVDAAPAAWTFAVPQAAAVAVTSYTVSARPAAWAFNVPRASIESVTFHRVPASNVAWEFQVPRAAAVVARRVNVSPASWSFNVPPYTLRPWPPSLPQELLRESFRQTPVDNVISAKVDRGIGPRRPRHTRAIQLIRCAIFLTPAQWVTLEEFYLDDLNGGSLPFDFPHPFKAEVLLLEFVRPPSRARSRANYIVSLQLKTV